MPQCERTLKMLNKMKDQSEKIPYLDDTLRPGNYKKNKMLINDYSGL